MSTQMVWTYWHEPLSTGGTILSETVKEKDLRVTMNANMKVSEQCRGGYLEGS